MEKFVSSWCDGKTLPESYVLPEGIRPNLFPISNINIPIIDMGQAHGLVGTQIMEASQEFGAFQVINHGVPRELMDEARRVFKEFFNLPKEDISKFISWDSNSKFCLYTSNFKYNEEDIHLWRDAFTQSCSPLEECISYWPDKPADYRDIAGEYIIKLKELGSRILEHISEGLGLESEYFGKELSQDVKMIVNHYPPCPDPSLTLGTSKHGDRSLLTILMQGQGNVSGLQYCKDGEWTNVDPSPDAFVIFLGHVMEMVSNGKLRRADHQSVTNRDEARESTAVFLTPTQNCIVEPAKTLITPENPPHFQSVPYHEFIKSLHSGRQSKANPEDIIKPYSAHAPEA